MPAVGIPWSQWTELSFDMIQVESREKLQLALRHFKISIPTGGGQTVRAFFIYLLYRNVFELVTMPAIF